MSTIVISPSNVVTFPEGGGHFWVYMQYVKGFLSNGCEVYWLERFVSSEDKIRDEYMVNKFLKRMERFGLGGKTILYTLESSNQSVDFDFRYINVTESEAESVFRRTDLLLNFYYEMKPEMLAYFKKTSLVDIDPGLLQFWISNGQINISEYDYYLTTGETVGTKDAKFPDCGFQWKHIRPPVCLESWPYYFDPACPNFTTISSWWGGAGKGEFITDGNGLIYENNKRVTFLEYVELPRFVDQDFELALNMGEGDEDTEVPKKNMIDGVTDYISDAVDRKIMELNGWRIINAYDAANSPELYQSYIQNSRGEFSCVKPSCLKFQNAWISDRTICYLASGKPVVTQDTGQSSFLQKKDGLFRFSTLDEAIEAFAIIKAGYEKQCRIAYEFAEAYFDARKITEIILNCCQCNEN